MLLCLSPMQQVRIYCCSFDVRLFITIVVSNHRSSQTSASYTQPPGLRCEYLKETIINLQQSDWQYFITNHQSLIMLQLSTVPQSPKPLTLSCWSPVGPSAASLVPSPPSSATGDSTQAVAMPHPRKRLKC